MAASRVATVLARETVPVSASDQRVLAGEVEARCDLPSFDTSAMDGWAVAGEAPWRVVGDVAAGNPHREALTAGTCVRIATGAVIPEGTLGVLRWERAELAAGVVRGDVESGGDIRRRGEECARGEPIAFAGTDVTPALAGFLAATGHDEVAVVRRPRAELILLGDELQESGIPSDGRVRDSLGPQLPGWLSRAGATVSSRHQVGDQLADVVEAFAGAAERGDLIITTGGTAEGPRDHVRGAVAALAGRLIVDHVAVRPGHPMLLGAVPGPEGREVPLVGLPGNPHSAVVGFVTLAVPVIDSMLGRTAERVTRVRASEELHAPLGHTRLVAGVLVDGEFVLSPYGGSAMLRGLAQSRGFAIVREPIPAGAPVEWLPLP
ncbi:MAG: hypothetical protein GC156_01085 [Actinomycetales bacterium]|nr:hypothetical protein [Actinomycetales bacterium]